MKKEGFVIYKSFYKPISRLSDKQLGRLFRAIFLYQLGEVVTVEEDIEMAFEFFKNQFEIDESKYQGIVEGNRNNGRKGGAPKGNSNAKKEKQAEQPKTTETTENKRSVVFQAKQAYKEKDKDKDKEKEKDNNNPPLSPNGDIPPGEPPAAVDDGNEGQQTPPSPPPEREKSSAKKEKETMTGKIEAAKAATLKRKKEFYDSLVPYVEKYGKEMTRKFFDYWSEMNKSGTKMRFELQKTWELGLRLSKWEEKDRIPTRGKSNFANFDNNQHYEEF